MLKAIPWETIGPAAIAAIIILAVVFAFMLKWQKGARPPIAPTNPPKDINATHKKSLCFAHEGRISSNETAIKMIGDQLTKTQEQNREDHGKIFGKMDDMREKIIEEIHKGNDKT